MNASNTETQPRMPRRGEIPTGAVAPEAPKVPAGFAINDPRYNSTTPTPEDFVAANRIHVKDGSFFIGPGLALHPRELDPKNEPALRAKLADTYKFDAPSFYDNPKRAMIALQLGALVPASLEAERAQLMGQVSRFNNKLANGTVDQANDAATYRMPMQTMAAELNHDHSPANNPLGAEHARNGLVMYMLMREALTRHGFLKHATDYIDYYDTPDQILNQLSDKLGYSVRDMRETALNGTGAVARKLGIDDATAYDITALSNYLTERHFSLNAIEAWHLGRAQAPDASIEQKIALGMAARIDRDVLEFRARAKGNYDVPASIKAEELRIAKALELVEPVERELLYKLGYHICFTADKTADKIADYNGILGLNRKIANDLRDVDANYYIYFAGQMDEKKSLRTLRHEIAHNLWPTRFTNEERAKIDQLAESDYTRLQALDALTTTHKDALEKFVGAYKAGNAEEKKAVAAAADDYFKKLGIRVSPVLPHLNGTEQLRYLVSEACSRINVDGDYYNHTNYHNPTVRFREMISRYSELQYVEHREKPDMQSMLAFVVPGMTSIFRDYYLPHLQKLNQELSGQALAPANVTEFKRASSTPLRMVDASSAHLEERVHNAYSALAQMGIDPTGSYAHRDCGR